MKKKFTFGCSFEFYRPFSFLLVLACLCNVSMAQKQPAEVTLNKKLGFGIKLGMNFAKLNSDADTIKYSYKPGLMVSLFLSPTHSGIIGYRTELLFSRQGFQYTYPGGASGNVTNDYLMMPHLMTINITKYVQLQAGAFAGYLLRSKDSNKKEDNNDTQGTPTRAIMNYMNRIDFGAAGGLEVYPFKGFIIGSRYNLGFTKLYKQQKSDPGQDNYPGYFTPMQNIDTKNAVIQLYVGYSF